MESIGSEVHSAHVSCALSALSPLIGGDAEEDAALTCCPTCLVLGPGKRISAFSGPSHVDENQSFEMKSHNVLRS